MRHLILTAFFIFGAQAFAAESPATPDTTASAPQCMTVQLDGKTTQACFGLSDEQVQSVTAEDADALYRRCEIRCEIYDHFGRCRHWRRFCW
jgi:hypothetical protein